jgi:ArsR family transcriptional regulator
MPDDKSYTCQVRALHEDAVEVARSSSLPDDEVFELARLFKVLGDISHVLGMSISSVSHQLRVLREQNLVKPRRDGKIVFYTLADPHVLDLHETALEHVRE